MWHWISMWFEYAATSIVRMGFSIFKQAPLLPVTVVRPNLYTDWDAHVNSPSRPIFHNLLEEGAIIWAGLWLDEDFVMHVQDHGQVLPLAAEHGVRHQVAFDAHDVVLGELAPEGVDSLELAGLRGAVLEGPADVIWVPGHGLADRLGVEVPHLPAGWQAGAQPAVFHDIFDPVSLMHPAVPDGRHSGVLEGVPHLRDTGCPLLTVGVHDPQAELQVPIRGVLPLELRAAHLEAQAEHAVLAGAALLRERFLEGFHLRTEDLGAGGPVRPGQLGPDVARHVDVHVSAGRHKRRLLVLPGDGEHHARLDAGEVARHILVALLRDHAVAQAGDHRLDGRADDCLDILPVARVQGFQDHGLLLGELDALVEDQGATGEVVGLEETARLAAGAGAVIHQQAVGAAVGADALLHAGELLDRAGADELLDLQCLADLGDETLGVILAGEQVVLANLAVHVLAQPLRHGLLLEVRQVRALLVHPALDLLALGDVEARQLPEAILQRGRGFVHNTLHISDKGHVELDAPIIHLLVEQPDLPLAWVQPADPLVQLKLSAGVLGAVLPHPMQDRGRQVRQVA